MDYQIKFLPPALKLLVVLFFLIFWGLQDRVYAGQTYYISTQGSDSNPGSISSPWRSLEFAVTIAKAGDTIIMRGGTYFMNEVWIDRNKGRGGAPGQYLTIKNFSGEQPFLKYSSRRLIIHADYVRVEGLHLEMPWSCEVFGTANQIINNKMTGPQPKFGAIETGGTDVLIEGNYIEYDDTGGNTQDHGIYVHKGQRITVRNNTIIGARGYGIHLFDEHKNADPAEWAANPFVIKDYTIEGNFVSGSQTRSGMIIAKGRGGAFITLENIIVRKNIFSSNHDFGLYIRQGDNVKVFNNTFYSDGIASLYIQPSNINGVITGASNLTVKNNIFVISGERAHVRNKATVPNFVLENNLYNTGPRIEGISDPKPIVADPLFVNENAADFNLQSISPAIDKGLDIGLPFAGAAPDLGAFEFGDPTSVGGSEIRPKIFSLHQNYPNPFNPETNIAYEILSSSRIAIYIYDIIGRKVRTLVNEQKTTGSYTVRWNGQNDSGLNVPSGVYFYKLEVRPHTGPRLGSQIKKMILLR